VERTADFHCVTTWSRFDNHWQGVAFEAICDLVKPKPEAKFVLFTSFDGYSTNLPLDLAREDALVVHHWEGRPLEREHGGPVRVVVSKVYAWKGAKWVKDIIFLGEDHPRLLGNPRLFQHCRPVDRRQIFVTRRRLSAISVS